MINGTADLSYRFTPRSSANVVISTWYIYVRVKKSNLVPESTTELPSPIKIITLV